jgi:hypothetical protein
MFFLMLTAALPSSLIFAVACPRPTNCNTPITKAYASQEVAAEFQLIFHLFFAY